MATKWGMYDTVDKSWFGDLDGPKLLDDFMHARVAAQMFDMQTGQTPGRTVAKEFIPGEVRLKGPAESRMEPETALQRLEEGRWV